MPVSPSAHAHGMVMNDPTDSESGQSKALIEFVLINAARDYLRVSEPEAYYTRVVATFFIFLVSLFAVSFPTLSKRSSFLRIPRIIFFIGKHFGTGVILSTAFVHLLQDSFEALRSPLVLARWKVGNYVGLIVLCSLLAIFVVEYVSTSFVYQLQSYSSPSTSIAPTPGDESPQDSASAAATPKLMNPKPSNPEQTPLIGETGPHHTTNSTRDDHDPSYGAIPHSGHTHSSLDGDAIIFEGHHRHESPGLHHSHHERGRPQTMYSSGELEQARPNGVGQIRHSDIGHHCHHDGFEDGEGAEDHHFHHHHHASGHEDKVKVGKRRQIVGILVLQLGIMIHSLVIGVTLSITSGPDFTTLLIAVIFHQLFEGLSLGIRIASLPSSREHDFKYMSILKPVLACLFAITTPAGILLGILLFKDNDDMAHVRLIQGIMSAISAGMLTYAACVEMLAGDFVMDPILWGSSARKQALALFSLAAGVASMALVGS